MWQIFVGSLLLSLIHASIPNHWIPLIALAKTEKWTLNETMAATLITGFSHTLSTIIIGIIVGFIGVKLSGSYTLIMESVAPGILIALGVIYILLNFKGHFHHHHSHDITAQNKANKTKFALLFSLSLAMFLTPCLEIEAYYFRAGLIGWKGIFIVSAVYTLVTVSLMLILVWLGYKGTRKLQSHFLEHYEKLITGVVLVVLGLLALVVKF